MSRESWITVVALRIRAIAGIVCGERGSENKKKREEEKDRNSLGGSMICDVVWEGM